MFLLVPAHPSCPRQNPESRKTVVCACVCVCAGFVVDLLDTSRATSSKQIETMTFEHMCIMITLQLHRRHRRLMRGKTVEFRCEVIRATVCESPEMCEQ